MTEVEATQQLYPVGKTAVAQVATANQRLLELIATIRNAVGAPAEFVLDLSASAFVPPQAEEETAKDDA